MVEASFFLNKSPILFCFLTIKQTSKQKKNDTGKTIPKIFSAKKEI